MEKDLLKTSVYKLVDDEKHFLASISEISEAEASLGCIDGKIIGTGRPDYTRGSTEYKLNVNNNDFLLIDIPGIEGDEEKFKEIIRESLMKAHLIFYVNGSGKKAEKETLEKIKKYMHDGTSVYALFNVHCKAKKTRVEGIDKTYAEELADAYKKQNEIVNQTEEELKAFLGHNFKGSISLNGLLSFCSVARDKNGDSTIVYDPEKNLRSAQSKFEKEYSGNLDKMQNDSHIGDVHDIIIQKIEHFDEYILEENIKKLKTRLTDMLSVVTLLKNNESSKIKNFQKDYSDFEKNCEMAKDDFIRTIHRIGRTEVEPAFFPLQEALFSAIEQCGGKLESYEIETIFNQHKDQLSKDIETAVTDKINRTVKEYRESIKEAENRLFTDLKREQKKFEISMSADQLDLDTSFLDSFKFTSKDFWKGAFKIGSYTLTGFKIGSFIIPVIGNIVGGIIGFLVGVGEFIWGLFASREKKINKAKARLKESLDEQIDSITDELRDNIKSLNLDEQINDNYETIRQSIEHQRKAFESINQLLNIVTKSLSHSLEQINL